MPTIPPPSSRVNPRPRESAPHADRSPAAAPSCPADDETTGITAVIRKGPPTPRRQARAISGADDLDEITAITAVVVTSRHIERDTTRQAAGDTTRTLIVDSSKKHPGDPKRRPTGNIDPQPKRDTPRQAMGTAGTTRRTGMRLKAPPDAQHRGGPTAPEAGAQGAPARGDLDMRRRIAELPRKRRRAFLACVLVTLADEHAGDDAPTMNDTRAIAFALKTNEPAVYQNFSRARAQLGLAESRRGRPDELRRRCEELGFVAPEAVDAAREFRAAWRREAGAEHLAALLDAHLAATRATKRARRAMARAWQVLGVALDNSGFRLDDLRSAAEDLGLEYAVIPRDEGAFEWASLFRKASSPWSPGRLAAWAEVLERDDELEDPRRAFKRFSQAADAYREERRRLYAAWDAVRRAPSPSTEFARSLKRFLTFCM